MREEFIRNGYLVVKGLICKELIREVGIACLDLLPRQENFFDTMGIDWQVSPFRELITNPNVLNLLRNDLKFGSLRFSGATLVNKKPFEPRRPWHQDWWAWTHEYPDPPQVGVLHYFTETTKENGCLRVLPKTHKIKHIIHENYYNANYTLADYYQEVAIEVELGDVVVIDTRLLHSTHSNNTDKPRVGINAWYFPEFNEFSDVLKKHVSHPVGTGVDDFLPVHNNPQYLILTKSDYHPKGLDNYFL